MPRAAAPAETDTPLYQQVKDHIVGRILAGEWAEGSRVPTEHELNAALAVSRGLDLAGWGYTLPDG